MAIHSLAAIADDVRQDPDLSEIPQRSAVWLVTRKATRPCGEVTAWAINVTGDALMV